MEEASSPSLRQATTVEGMVSSEDPTLSKEGLSAKGPPPSPVLPPRRRKCRKCGICPQEEEKSGSSLRLGQRPDGDPPDRASPEAFAGPPRLLSSMDTEPGEPGGSWVECALEAEVENMLFFKDGVAPDSLDHLFEFPGLFGGEPLSLVTREPPQSPALYPEVLTEDSTDQQEVQPAFAVGSPGTPPDPAGPEDKTQSGSRMELEQGLAAPANSCASFPEPLGGLDGAPLEQRRPTHVKKRPWASPDDSSPDHAEGASKKDFPRLSDPSETEHTELLQQRAEDPGEQGMTPLDAGVRSTVVRAMQEVLWTRAQELPDLALREDEVEAIAEGIEEALFHLTQDTNLRYKNKYRSLLFNLRDPRNVDLFLKVAHCDVTPNNLVQMSSIQLAPKELSRWRDQEERKGLDIIEQQQKELYRLPASKLTHKGEVEIPRDSDQMLTLEDLMEPMVPRECSLQPLTTPLEGTTNWHQHHQCDSNCQVCTGGEEGRKADDGSQPELQVDISYNVDRKSSTKLPAFSGAIMNREENAIQKAPGPSPVSSPEVLKVGETPPKEPQDRLQMPAGPKNAPPSPTPWEGSLDMFSIKHFRAKAQLISGHSCQLVQALPDVIRSAGRLPPSHVWDLLDSMGPSKAKDICVIRLCPHGSRDIQNYRLLYSYLNNKQCHCLATVPQVKMVLLPLPAFEPLPARLRPLGGPGLEITHTSLLLAVLFPKDELPDTAMSIPVSNKVPKTVSFSKRVERIRYSPEDRRSEATSSPLEEDPKQSLARGSLTPRSVCAPQSLPRGRGRQGPGWGQWSPEAAWRYSQHPSSADPVFPGIGQGQHLHRASCFHHDLLQHLKVLVTMSHQFQASLWPQSQDSLPPFTVGSAVPDPPGPSLGPMDGGGSNCPLPEGSDPLEPPEQEC
ncbi:SPOC domain-containing protein 1 [Mus caroli]|uniref:SPOC domain-containing protein 1 n=1 Tax=Mus caroli TaxID=10089 RepID=A0A6P5PP85_MUSCR|nr:SPOC domain-containing protein 1 [Mus caroli]